jgi:Ser/Thr protein kinase RdoA (MazF antagonist)
LSTHGDPQANNAMWDGHRVATLIDFHIAGEQPAVAELAGAIDRNALHWLEILEGDDDAWSSEVAAAIVGGYVAERPLDAVEQATLGPMLALHRLDFAWSLLDYYATVERSTERAAWCRDVFLQAHPRWLASPAGAAVIDAVTSASR